MLHQKTRATIENISVTDLENITAHASLSLCTEVFQVLLYMLLLIISHERLFIFVLQSAK